MRAFHNQCGPSCTCHSCISNRSVRNVMSRDVYMRYLEERMQRLELIVAANTQRIAELENENP